MRRAPALLLVLAPLFLLRLAACSSSSQTGPIGPVFDASPIPDDVTDHVPDTATIFDVAVDHSSPRDEGGGDVNAPMDASHDAGTPDTGVPRDAGTDAHDAHVGVVPDAGPCPSASGTVALVGGTTSSAFAAVSKNGAAFVSSPFPNVTVGATPAVVAMGAGEFLGVFPTLTTDYIKSVSYALASGWSGPTAIPALPAGDAAATETAAPSLALLGSNAELVYYGSNTYFYHGIYASGVWGPANDAVGGTVSQDFGPSQPGAAATSSTLYVAWDGMNHGLYVDSWTPTLGWEGAEELTAGLVGTVPPTLVGLSGGTADLMLVYEQETTTLLFSIEHTPGTGWGVPVEIGTALTPTQVSLAPLLNGGVALVYEGSNSFAYGSVFSPGAGTWSTPVVISASGASLASPPTVASGACGFDAIAAYAAPSGVAIVDLKDGAWSTPNVVTSLSGMTYATVATSP